VKLDPNIIASDVACFCETRLWHLDTNEDTSLEIKHQYRQDSKHIIARTRLPHGIAVYSGSCFTYGPFEETSPGIEMKVLSVKQQPEVIIVAIYKTPKASAASLVKLIKAVYNKHVHESKAIFL